MNILFLPATAPCDTTYGETPKELGCLPSANIHTIQYPQLVWYNNSVREEAIAQIRALKLSDLVLVGFSKSGLGAWNIARAIPDLVAATIIFDAPVARQARPPWGTNPFYKDDAAWQRDLPLNSVADFQAVMPSTHQLVLISGPGFHDEMLQLSAELSSRECDHAFLPRQNVKHHWNAGWIEEGLEQLTTF